jgi:diguanylate cyclase (GGDEF)-like protein
VATPADLDHRFRIRLWGVALIFVLALVLTLWMGYREADARYAELLQQQQELLEKNVLRRLDFYRRVAEKLVAEPETHDQLVLGDAASQQRWAETRLRILPDVLGLALFEPGGRVLGNAGELRVGAACARDLEKPGALDATHLQVHRDRPELAHFDLVVSVTGPGGEKLGGVFVSLRLEQLQRVVDDSRYPGHVLEIVDGAGNVVVRTQAAQSGQPDIDHALRDTGWRLRIWGGQPALSHAQLVMIAVASATLLAVLVVMLQGMGTLERNIRADLATIRDGLAAVASGSPLPPLTPTYIQFLPAIREIERIAGEIEKQRSEFARQSLTDTLTSLPNRRALEGRFTQMLGLAQRGHAIALVLMDLDHFKALNDSQGHAVGDKALRALAAALAATSRSADFAARLAGDEFVALLTGLDVEGTASWYMRLADRFQAELRASGIEARLGLSAGHTWLAGNDTLGRVLTRADRALYRAKAEGRARLAFHTDLDDAAAR